MAGLPDKDARCRRIETLINLVEKEFEEQDKGAKRPAGGSAGGGSDAKKAKA